MNYAVIGLGFGDEGKGLVTEYLCSHSPYPLVVRFSGGHQAGHTVVKNGVKHIFTNFGSGTLSNAPTFWSKHCTIEPIGLIKEYYILKDKGIEPILFIDPNCPVTTPYDIKYNHKQDRIDDHGTCGVGFGATIQREKNHYSLTYSDLFNKSVVFNKMKLIKEYYAIIDADIDNFYECINMLNNGIDIIRIANWPRNHYDYIFEGSQGLLLDQDYGFFPHVTYSNTGSKNLIELGYPYVEFYLVTRAYQTRHGNGPMTNETISTYIKQDDNEINITNKFQGQFRKTVLDLDLLLYGINKDDLIRTSSKKNLVITCMDHIVDSYWFTHNNKLVKCSDAEEFITKISSILGIGNVYISESPESKNIYKFNS